MLDKGKLNKLDNKYFTTPSTNLKINSRFRLTIE